MIRLLSLKELLVRLSLIDQIVILKGTFGEAEVGNRLLTQLQRTLQIYLTEIMEASS